jgi:hypothetical protein
MLKRLVKKFPPLFGLIAICSGCGKKIDEPKNSSILQQTQNQQTPTLFIVGLDGSLQTKKSVPLPQNAQFEVPGKIRIQKGNSSNKSVEIAYDVNPYDSDDYQFKCIYNGNLPSNEMILNKCVNWDGENFGNVSGHTFSLYKNDIIEMKFSGASAADLKVEAYFDIKWQ